MVIVIWQREQNVSALQRKLLSTTCCGVQCARNVVPLLLRDEGLTSLSSPYPPGIRNVFSCASEVRAF